MWRPLKSRSKQLEEMREIRSQILAAGEQLGMALVVDQKVTDLTGMCASLDDRLDAVEQVLKVVTKKR